MRNGRGAPDHELVSQKSESYLTRGKGEGDGEAMVGKDGGVVWNEEPHKMDVNQAWNQKAAP